MKDDNPIKRVLNKVDVDNLDFLNHLEFHHKQLLSAFGIPEKEYHPIIIGIDKGSMIEDLERRLSVLNNIYPIIENNILAYNASKQLLMNRGMQLHLLNRFVFVKDINDYRLPQSFFTGVVHIKNRNFIQRLKSVTKLIKLNNKLHGRL